MFGIDIAAFFAKPIVKYGGPVLVLGGLCLALWIQGQRMHSWKELAKARGIALDQVASVQKEQNERVIAWAKAIEDAGKRISNNADRNYRAGFMEARAAADDYIARNRLRPRDRSGAINPAPAAQGDGPGVPASLPANSVVVSAADVQACGDLYLYALEAHNWAVDLVKGSQAKPVPSGQ